MSTYYVRLTGNDSSAGTTPATAWRTWTKALGASGIASGDRVYIGPGTYRETVQVAMTSPTVETFVSGDPLGQYTGDAPGPVILSSYTNGPYAAGSASIGLDLNARDFLTFEDIWFSGSQANINTISSDTSGLSTNITFRRFGLSKWSGQTAAGIAVYAAYGSTISWVIEDFIITGGGSAGINPNLIRGAAGDYDADIQIRRGLIVGGARGVRILTSGAGANYGGGVDMSQLAVIGFGTSGIATDSPELSTSIPSTVKNCLLLAAGSVSGLSANASGQITDAGDNISISATTNVTAHATSRHSATIYETPLAFGMEALWGLPSRAVGSMYPGYGLIGQQ